jgi:NADH:ubiquinone oxidoreductase subunit H
MSAFLDSLLSPQVITSIVVIFVIINVMMGAAAYSVLLERKISAWIQDRIGPNRVGPMGLLQPIADGIKLVVKEEFIPRNNNKYSFYGGMRAAAQMISYELPLGLGLIVILIIGGTLRPEILVDQQAASGIWNVLLHPVAFFLVLVASFAETNRTPFDLAEAEQELVGGFHTEYSAMKFAMFFLAEYAHMIIGSALMVAVFLGGWHIWGGPGPEDITWTAMLIKFVVYLSKVALFIFLFMLIRWTIPRFRFDQLMRLAWDQHAWLKEQAPVESELPPAPAYCDVVREP